MATIPDFNKNEKWIVHGTLKQRYDKDIEVQKVDTELRLNPHSLELTPCPAVYRQILLSSKPGRAASAVSFSIASISSSAPA